MHNCRNWSAASHLECAKDTLACVRTLKTLETFSIDPIYFWNKTHTQYVLQRYMCYYSLVDTRARSLCAPCNVWQSALHCVWNVYTLYEIFDETFMNDVLFITTPFFCHIIWWHFCIFFSSGFISNRHIYKRNVWLISVFPLVGFFRTLLRARLMFLRVISCHAFLFSFETIFRMAIYVAQIRTHMKLLSMNIEQTQQRDPSLVFELFRTGSLWSIAVHVHTTSIQT